MLANVSDQFEFGRRGRVNPMGNGFLLARFRILGVCPLFFVSSRVGEVSNSSKESRFSAGFDRNPA